MKEANIVSIISAYNKLDSKLFDSYLKHHSIVMKTMEINDLKGFVDGLSAVSNDADLFDNYFIGYSIPQIGKEFDLLRIGAKNVINIELKQTNTGDKIRKQLERNRYYLSFLNKIVFNYTFVTDENKLYTLDDHECLVETDFDELFTVLVSENVKKIKGINNLFNPSNYLVSPFNSTEKFIESKYFLTQQQEQIKKNIVKLLQSQKFTILSIKGSAGTGKTLLTYDIAKEFVQNDSVLIIHCGQLNEGHLKLKNNYNWNIIAIRDILIQDLNKYSLIVIDEAQRIYPIQLIDIIEMIEKYSLKCIFSYDGEQCLRSWEIKNNIEKKIEDKVTFSPFKLTNTIRTNKDLSMFIKALFDKKATVADSDLSNVEINYFSKYGDVNAFLEIKKLDDWKIINYTQSRDIMTYDKYHRHEVSDNSHKVMGQEFEKVVVIIDHHFYYHNDILAIQNYSKTPYYLLTKMLFQNLTRARSEINIIILNNTEILERCLSILK
ncbi:DNA/RNA helicase domain-containing protein [Flavobacterium sp. FlaQc-51]|uniref:DNA/RNA helicase domain-containing protein n=1 Tax=Flavobacterium sp. FlaQc-51 TaxID=3374184 RepID=UPI0037570298